MRNGRVQIFCGNGFGKTSAALGLGLQAVNDHRTVIMIQFLKGSVCPLDEVMQKLEPDFKLFRFEKSPTPFKDLSEQEKQDELHNIRNGLNFAKKVLLTQECDVLILDEILGLVDEKIVPQDDVIKLIESRDEAMDLILTGKLLPPEIHHCADIISEIAAVEVDKKK